MDVLLVPEIEALLRAVQQLKDELEVNVELASPADFIPIPSGWEDRSVFVTCEGRMSYFHFDLLAQALAKLERAHAQDLDDVDAMLERGLVERDAVLAYFAQIEPDLYRFPAIDPATFRARVEETSGQTAR